MVMINKVQMAPPAYADVNRLYPTNGVSMVSMDNVSPFRVTKRHVEISAADRYPDGLEYLLRVTKSISMLGDYGRFNELEECMLRRCHQMVQVFSYNWDVPPLQNAYVSRLRGWRASFDVIVSYQALRRWTSCAATTSRQFSMTMVLNHLLLVTRSHVSGGYGSRSCHCWSISTSTTPC